MPALSIARANSILKKNELIRLYIYRFIQQPDRKKVRSHGNAYRRSTCCVQYKSSDKERKEETCEEGNDSEK